MIKFIKNFNMDSKKLITILSVFILFYGCEIKNSPVLKIENYTGPDSEMIRFILTGTYDNKKEWILEGDFGQTFETKREMIGENIKITFFNDNKPISILHSKKGFVNLDTNDMRAEGNVLIYSKKNDKKLETESISWSEEQDKIISDSWVKVTEKDCITTGKGFETDTNLDKVVIRENIKIILKNAEF